MTLVFVALLLVVLMVFAAFAVDLGLIMNERRQDQGAVDSSAMSAAVVALGGGDLQAAVNEVLAQAAFDVNRAITDQQWIDCRDTPPAAYVHTAVSLSLTPRTPCISWTVDFSKMRVRLPDQVLKTSFARVIGIDTLSTRAFAEVEFVPRTEGGAALPFVALAGASTGQHICIRTSSSGDPPTQMVGNGPGNPATVGVPATPGQTNDADPCDGTVYDPGSSTFGTLTPRDYKGGCDTQNDNVMEAIMQGTDHPTGFFADPPFSIPNGGTSSAAQTARVGSDNDVHVDGPGPRCTTFMPNTIEMNSGLSAGNLRCALVSPRNSDVCSANGNANNTPRMKRATSLQSNVFVGESIDNTPAWEYFTSSSNLPTSCKDLRTAHQTNDVDWDFYDRREAFLECLDDWNKNSHDQLFTEAIGGSPRLAYVPQIAERRLCDAQDPPANCTPTLAFAHVNSYLPIFLNKLYVNAGGNSLGCEILDLRPHSWYMQEAGQTFPLGCGPSNGAIDRLSAIVFDCAMLPKAICDPDLLPGIPGNDGSIQTIFEARLFR